MLTLVQHTRRFGDWPHADNGLVCADGWWRMSPCNSRWPSDARRYWYHHSRRQFLGGGRGVAFVHLCASASDILDLDLPSDDLRDDCDRSRF